MTLGHFHLDFLWSKTRPHVQFQLQITAVSTYPSNDCLPSWLLSWVLAGEQDGHPSSLTYHPPSIMPEILTNSSPIHY